MKKIHLTKNEKSRDYCKADQSNVYCFVLTIFRLATPAFFRFTDVTEFVVGNWRMSNVRAVTALSHKHANSKVQNPPSQLRFWLPSIIITITINKPWNTETHKMDQSPPITNHKPWPFESVKEKFCFLRGPLRWMTVEKNANASCLLNFRIHVFCCVPLEWSGSGSAIQDHLIGSW